MRNNFVRTYCSRYHYFAIGIAHEVCRVSGSPLTLESLTAYSVSSRVYDTSLLPQPRHRPRNTTSIVIVVPGGVAQAKLLTSYDHCAAFSQTLDQYDSQ